MSGTKENILQTALRLFARDGYEAVSVSAIAGELGMTKGALYKHYKNKRDIFDHIVERIYQMDAERAIAFQVPDKIFDENPEAYRNASAERISRFTKAQLDFWTENEFACSFRKMMTIEQYRNTEMSQLYQQCFASGPISYMADLFREMMAEGIWIKNEPRQLAVEFFAPLYLLWNVWDVSPDKEEIANILDMHTRRFFRNNLVEPE